MIKRIYLRLVSDPLYRNSMYLMASSAVLMGTGFLFWVIVARVYSIEQVGIATTIYSLLTTVSGLSMLGITSGLMRFLPTSSYQHEKVSTSLTIAITTTGMASLITLYFLANISPRLLFLTQHPGYIVSFILFCLFLSVGSIIETTLLSLRRAKNILFKNIILGLVKLALPLTLLFLGAFGIVVAMMGGLLAALSYCFLILYMREDFRFRILIHKPSVIKLATYSIGSYIGSLAANLHTYILPIFITNVLSVQATAYYTIGATVASVIFVIPQVVSQSFFVEGSYHERKMNLFAKKAFKMIMIFLLPSILAMILFGGIVLHIFGKEYSQEGISFLRIYAASGIFVGVNYVCGTMLYIQKRIKTVIALSLVSSLLIIMVSLLLKDMGLTGVGYATFLSQLGLFLLYGMILRLWKHTKEVFKPVFWIDQKARG